MKVNKKAVYLTAMTALFTTPSIFANQNSDLSHNLSVTGFIDTNWSYIDTSGADSDQSFAVDQVEFNVLYQFEDKLKAQVDLEYQDDGDGNGEEVDVEQAFISYDVSNDFTVKLGRFLSYSGWETEEPTGLYQYSGTGYGAYFYGGYQQGVSGKYTTDTFAAAVSIVNDLGDSSGENRNADNKGIETMLAFMPTEQITIKGFYMTDELEGSDETTHLMNIWSSYVIDDFTFAVEYNDSENAPAAVAIAGINAEANGYLLMGNYAINNWGFTLRYHAYEIENSAGNTLVESSGITFSPNYKFNDNLLMVFEYRTDSEDVGDTDTDSVALRALVTF